MKSLVAIVNETWAKTQALLAQCDALVVLIERDAPVNGPPNLRQYVAGLEMREDAITFTASTREECIELYRRAFRAYLELAETYRSIRPDADLPPVVPAPTAPLPKPVADALRREIRSY